MAADEFDEKKNKLMRVCKSALMIVSSRKYFGTQPNTLASARLSKLFLREKKWIKRQKTETQKFSEK